MFCRCGNWSLIIHLPKPLKLVTCRFLMLLLHSTCPVSVKFLKFSFLTFQTHQLRAYHFSNSFVAASILINLSPVLSVVLSIHRIKKHLQSFFVFSSFVRKLSRFCCLEKMLFSFLFYVLCSLRVWRIITLHRFLPFILSNVKHWPFFSTCTLVFI